VEIADYVFDPAWDTDPIGTRKRRPKRLGPETEREKLHYDHVISEFKRRQKS